MYEDPDLRRSTLSNPWDILPRKAYFGVQYRRTVPTRTDREAAPEAGWRADLAPAFSPAPPRRVRFIIVSDATAENDVAAAAAAAATVVLAVGGCRYLASAVVDRSGAAYLSRKLLREMNYSVLLPPASCLRPRVLVHARGVRELTSTWSLHPTRLRYVSREDPRFATKARHTVNFRSRTNGRERGASRMNGPLL